jgi:hypothetical protein
MGITHFPLLRDHAGRRETPMEYKNYVIDEFVNEKGQWQARIRRGDGKHVRADGLVLREFTTRHADSENEAIRIAKEAIDSRKVAEATD